MSIFVEDTPRAVPFNLRRFLAELARRARAHLARILTRRRALRQIHLLRGLEDHVLRDIGVTRRKLDGWENLL